MSSDKVLPVSEMADEEEDSESEVEEYSGMEQPPLIKQLKTILAEYPDDGQIIKELVQNAEDAEASEMKILYDGRRLNTEISRKVLYRKFFKAPALCFYNNEVFSEADWRGIKMIYSSVKEEDPLKVGRFGLGFKSVFHVTDNPCIISGNRILLMNPHEKVPDKVCITIKLKNLRKSKRLKEEELLDALSDTFGFTVDNLNTGIFQGTIFWFPLRETVTDIIQDRNKILSDTCYNRSKVLDLFRSFQTEATHSLLFLKSLCKIEVYCRGSETEFDLPNQEPFFTVKLDDVEGNIRDERQRFLQEVKATYGSVPGDDIVSIVRPTFKTCYKTLDHSEVDDCTSWLVIRLYKGDKMSEKLKGLVRDKGLSYIPYVGAAIPLTDTQESFKGHIFCFLPLPQEKKSLTGFPVHFNGYFALSQNRRHLKWASADQESLHMHRDKAIEWNECLVNEVIPGVYLRLIKEMITISTNGNNTEQAVEAVYKCIPDDSAVDTKWEECAKALYQHLLGTDFVFIEKQSKWVLPFQPLYTMFDMQNVPHDQQETVIKLLNLHKNVVSTKVPVHIWELLKKLSSMNNIPPPKDITPYELCKIIKIEMLYRQGIDKKEKIQLLEYVTKDKCYTLLQGLELIPLENGAFMTFQDMGTRPSSLYLCIKEVIDLFPGLEDRFISSSISTHLRDVMKEMVYSGKFQLRCLAVSGMVSLLEEMILQNFGNSEPVKVNMSENANFNSWIENIWVYLFEHFSEFLSKFENLPLLPCLITGNWIDETWKHGEVHLYRMNRRFVLKSSKDLEELPDSVCDAFRLLSVVVLPSLPEWIEVGKLSCVFSTTGPRLIKLFDELYSKTPECIGSFNSKCSLSEAEALVTFIDKTGCELSRKVRIFLRQLNLFNLKESLSDKNSILTSVSEYSRIVNSNVNIPVRFPKPYLVSNSRHYLSLAVRLEVDVIGEDTLVSEILRDMQKGSYSNSEVESFMLWFLTNIYKFQEKTNIMLQAQTIKFVSNGICLYKPSELFDPRETRSLELFSGENKFPVQNVSEIHLNALKSLGLKVLKDVTADCLYTTATILDRMCKAGADSAKLETKAKALFQMLVKKSDVLCSRVEQTGHTLHFSIRNLRCLPHKKQKAADYPEGLIWKGTEFTLCSPMELKNATMSNVIGSVLPVVECDSETLGQYYNWSSLPEAVFLIDQLENLMAVYKSANKACFLPFILAVYRAMAGKAEEIIGCKCFQKLLKKKCIWWGNGFCKPGQIVLEICSKDIDLTPYVYTIPTEMEILKAFFYRLRCNKRQDVHVLLNVLGLVAKKHEAQRMSEHNIRKDLHLVLQILKRLFEENVSPGQIGAKLLFPIHTGDKETLIFKPYTQCTYCDTQWLKEITDEDGEEDQILYVHADVPLKVAEGLGVKSLKRQLMSDAEGLEEWGQNEPLTRRLHNILKDGYIDGLAVPKEIIQNADDAKATKVHFIYDERENEDARTQLLDEGMAGCQGPALWAFNDALFTDKDLKNITKLSGATKETDTTKVGKFGLGFCAVYNLTDVPSFVSGQNMVIFDPHTKYLNKALPGQSPGLKIDLSSMKNKMLIKRMNNQFKPFNGVSGCNLSQEEPYFEGTLFRLPLRTQSQADTSEIKKISYSRREMVALLQQFVEAVGNMLLFTQNLQEIKVFHIPASGLCPQKAVLLCSVSKVLKLNTLEGSILDVCSKLKIVKSLKSNPFATVQTLIITLKCEDHRGVLGDIKSENTQTRWLVSWATGTAKALDLSYSTDRKGALPLGSVAIFVESDTDSLIPNSLSECPFGFYKTGHVFCYLPLPVTSKLDFHINGSFAVASNRRSLLTNTEDDKYCYESQWNEALLSDAVSQALINILEIFQDPKQLSFACLAPQYLFHHIWPTKDAQMLSVSQGFYRKIIETNSQVFQTFNDFNWLGLKQCLFLDTHLATDIRQVALSTLQRFKGSKQTLKSLTIGIVDIPSLYLQELQSAEGWDKDFVVGVEDFLMNVFLPNIADPYWEESDEKLEDRISLILYCLDQSTPNVSEKLRSIACIPTRPNGILRKPRDLVYPKSQISHLFDVSDGRFPVFSFENHRVLQKLVDLGMMEDTLEPDIVKDRARSIENLTFEGSVDSASDRCKHFIEYMTKYVYTHENIFCEIKNVKFLPVLEKPEDWPFTWKSETAIEPSIESSTNNVNRCFESPSKLYFGTCKNLVACDKHIIDTSRVAPTEAHKHTLHIMGVNSVNHVTIETVINQLLTVCALSNSEADNTGNHITDEVLDAVYSFINKAVIEMPDVVKPKLQILKDERVIHIGSEFLSSSKVVFSLEYNCSPDLHAVGADRIKRHKPFLEAIGVREHFEVDAFVEVLKKKSLKYKNLSLPDFEFQLVSRLLLCLTNLMVKSEMTYEELAHRLGRDNIVAPDTSKILRPTYMLCFDDCDFIEATTSMKFIHGDISRTGAERLGVLTKRTKHIEDCSIEIPFEQKEELVTRLKRILDGYPQSAVLKELIQNADDAGASEIHFLKDLGKHDCNKIFDSSFSEFQGPALCVYNDSYFTKTDLSGIQQLGVGSKSDDPAKTGQYGVGFNAVYNLTDLPSFLTKGPDIEGGETLCIFDPLHKHCKKRVGTRYVDMQAVRRSYPDVLSGFNEDHFFTSQRTTGTVFRFPLRKFPSAISSNVISTDELETKVFAAFKTELFEMMLFLRHLKTITVSVISGGNFKTERSVSVSLTDEDICQREVFSKHLKKIGRELKDERNTVFKLQPLQVSYRVHNLSNDEKWLVVQRSGISGDTCVPQSVELAVRSGNLKMLPVGGVAVRLPKKEQTLPPVAWKYENILAAKFGRRGVDDGRPFCFLPLPGKTGLPVHVNGHFILDHEARRGLWKREHKEEFKSDWNKLLISEIISVAFVEALKFIKRCLLFQDECVKYSSYDLLNKLTQLNNFFPIAQKAKDENWKNLVQSSLLLIKENAEKMFPIVLQDTDKDKTEQYVVKWNSLFQENHKFPVFVSDLDMVLSITNPLQTLLRSLGMKVSSIPVEVSKSFEDSKMTLPFLDALSVIQFMKSNTSSAQDKIKIDKIPCKLEETLLINVRNVDDILIFCSDSESFETEVDGLPLLVTNDDTLRCFNVESPAFCTEYAEIFPKSAERFVHKKQISTIHKINVEKIKSVIKNLHVEDLENLLTTELNVHVFSRNEKVEWTLSNFDFPNEWWVKKLWAFLELDFETSKNVETARSFNEYLQPLENWCLVPAVVGKSSHFLVKISKLYSVLALDTFTGTQAQEALQNLELPCLYTNVLSEHSQSLITAYLARAQSPVSALIFLKYYMEEVRDKLVESWQCSAILGYFSDNIKTILKEKTVEKSWIVESLMCLPFFINKEGSRVSLRTQDLRILVVPDGIPEDGLEQWANASETVLLRNDQKLTELYSFLGFIYTENIDVYLDHILPTWRFIPDSAILAHLEYIKNEILSCFAFQFNQKQNCMINMLKDLPIIPEKGKRKKISEYYSPHHPVFKALCSAEEFPPERLCKKEWKTFLELIDLKHVVSNDMFVRFAKEVAALGRFRITDAAAEKSAILVKHLFTYANDWNNETYNEISHIKFVLPHTVDEVLRNVHEQYSEPDKFICFRNSISQKFFCLVWTSVPLLHVSADPDDYYVQGNKKKALGVYKGPPLKCVINHTQNICCSLKRILENKEYLKTNQLQIESLMDTIYEFLQSHGMSEKSTKDMLFHTPVIYIPQTKLFVPAHSIIEDISSDQEIFPYLLKAPVRYGKFFKLFGFLGAEKYPSFVNYIKVLSMIKNEVKENKLTQEYLSEWGVIKAALENLFFFLPETSQQVEQETPPGTTLYLPTRDWYMKDSSSLIVADNQYFEQRIGTALRLQFLINFKAVKLSHSISTLRWLPRSIQPRFLSDIIKEEIDTSQMIEISTHPSALKVEKFIHSEQFIEALLRLLKHFKANAQLPFTKREEEDTVLKLQNTRLQQVSGLRTHLFMNGVKIEDSAVSKECFVPRIGKSGNNENFKIFFQGCVESEIEFVHSIDEYLITYVHNILSFNIPEHLIMKVFYKINNPESISFMLDKIPIDPYHISTSALSSVFPEPGTYVPVELHHLLNCDFSQFGPHEYHSVALELEDAGLLDENDFKDSYSPVYIYVRIETQVPTEGKTSVISERYEVFTGSETVIVPAFQIYKFIRPRQDTVTDVVDAGSIPQPRHDQSLEKALCCIKDALQEAWTLSEEDRRRIIKRLYLRWHPDKNIGNEDFCSQVFQYIKDVIYKLEKGIPLDDDDTDGASGQSDFSSQYFRFYERMDRRGRAHRKQAQAFSSPGLSGYGGCGFAHRDSCNQTFKDIAEGRRWQRQAEIDLQNAIETIDARGDPPAYNWICYMCHQASEKSLKAAGFVRDANSVHKNSHDIVELASGFSSVQSYAGELANLVGVHTKMRYPDVLHRPYIPSTVYSREQAVRACELAKIILDCVKENYLN